MIYRARNPQTSYGRPVGIILLEEHIPCPPGTPGNPTTFAHPVCYEIVRGVTTADLRGPREGTGVASFIAAGRSLVERGACAIAGNCGLMIVHQEALAGALPVPVFMSSLLQLPLIATILGPAAAIGILASSGSSLNADMLRLATPNRPVRTVIASMDGKPHFGAAVREQSGELDFDAVTAEVVEVARDLVEHHPDVRAILLECVDLPPYAAAVQAAVGVPVFDITTLIGHLASALVRKPFVGAY